MGRKRDGGWENANRQPRDYGDDRWRLMRSRFGGRCDQCGEGFGPGTAIRWMKGQAAVHAGDCYLNRVRPNAAMAIPPLAERRARREAFRAQEAAEALLPEG